MLEGMSLGVAPRQTDVFATTTSFCEGRVAPDSIYGLLHRECFGLFPDELFADLFCDIGRRSVPPMIVAVVMVLQRIEGCSDREAVERFTYDVRWKYAAGGLGFDYPGFVRAVVVDVRAALGAGKPVCDYDDAAAREALVDALARDARALLVALDGRRLSAALAQAAALLAAVVGQDLQQGADGVFRIARRVARDRIISTVDPDA